MIPENELRQLFKNRSDCYADTWMDIGIEMKQGDVVQAMTEDRFIETVNEALRKHGVMQGCQCKDRIGETKVWCCNQCGLPCEDFWLPTHYTVGSRTVGNSAAGQSGSDGMSRAERGVWLAGLYWCVGLLLPTGTVLMQLRF